MKTVEETMSIINLEKNHRKINTLEEIETLKAASSKHLLNDDIARQHDPMYGLLPSISDLKSNSQLPKPGDRRNFDTQQLKESVIWTRMVNWPGRATEEISTSNKDQQNVSTNWRKAYRNKQNKLNGTMVKPENIDHSNFDWNPKYSSEPISSEPTNNASVFLSLVFR